MGTNQTGEYYVQLLARSTEKPLASAERHVDGPRHFDPFKFRARARPTLRAEALLAVMEREAIGTDEVTDLAMVNMKGPDYTAYAYGPDSRAEEGDACRARSTDGAPAGASRQEGGPTACRRGDR